MAETKLKTYSVGGSVTASTYIGEFKAESPEAALALASKRVSVSVCHQCASDIQDPEVSDLWAEDEDGNVTRESEGLRTPRDELEEARAELGVWLAAEDGRVRYTMPVGDLVQVSLYQSGDSDVGQRSQRPRHGEGPTEAAAIRAALSRARGEGT